MEPENNLDIESMSLEEIEAELGGLSNKLESGPGVPTDTPTEPDTQQPSTEGNFVNRPQQEPSPGLGGFVKDTIEGTAKNMYEGAAPIVGLSDTVIDAINFASAGDTFDIPKLPEYESKMHTAVRNISGLIIPSLGLRSMALNAGAKIHAAGKAAPWLQKLGNSKSFEYFAKFGIDVGSGAAVDYVAEQNQKDDNLMGVLKNYWPKIFQWIPNSIATTEDDSAGEKRAKNVNEGAIFSIFASII